jgi:hypothetical protein
LWGDPLTAMANSTGLTWGAHLGDGCRQGAGLSEKY